MVGAAIGIDDQVKNRAINGYLLQRNFARKERDDLDPDGDAVGMGVRDLIRGFAAVNGQIANLKLQSGKLPGEKCDLNLATSHALKIGHDTSANAFAK